MVHTRVLCELFVVEEISDRSYSLSLYISTFTRYDTAVISSPLLSPFPPSQQSPATLPPPTYTTPQRETTTYDHRNRRTSYPVRSSLYKPVTGGLVVKWVTIGESPLLYVFAFGVGGLFFS